MQFGYSIASRAAEVRLLPLCAERGVAILVNQPFDSGSLFGQVKGKVLPEWASEFDCTSWSQFFLKYILSHPAVTCVIPGTARPDHMRDNIGAGLGRLPDERSANACSRIGTLCDPVTRLPGSATNGQPERASVTANATTQ